MINNNLLFLVILVQIGALIKQLWIHIHEYLESIIHQSMDGSVPVLLREGVQWLKHDGHDGLYIVMHQIHDKVIIPEVESPLCDLKMTARDTLSNLFKDGHTDFGKLAAVNNVEDLFNLVEKHDLLGAVDFGPVTQQTIHDGLGQRGILLQKLHDTVRQLRVVRCQAAWLMQRHQDANQEGLVLLLQGQRKPVDDTSQDFQQFSNPVEALRLVDELEKDVVDRFSNVGSQVEEFAVQSVQGGLEKVALAWIFAVE